MCEVAQRFAGLARARLEHPGGARVRLRALGRTGLPGRPRRRDPVADAPAARGERHLALPLRRAAPTRHAPSSSVDPAPRTSLGSPSSRRATSTISSPGSTRRGCGSRRSRASRSRRSGSRASGSTPPSRRSPRSPVSSRRGCASTRRTWPSSPRPPPGAWAYRPTSVTLVRRAALAHDLGRVGVSNAIWEKPGPLGFGEWERVRLHPHFTERAFAQSPALAPIGLLAGSHHERLDGSGYHRGTRGAGARSAGPHPRRRRLLQRHARGAAVQAGARRRRPQRQSCCARPERDGSTPTRSTRCSTPPATACRRAPRELPGRADRARAGGPPRARARRVQPGDRRRISASRQDRRAPRPARLPEGRRPHAAPPRRSGRSSTTSSYAATA